MTNEGDMEMKTPLQWAHERGMTLLSYSDWHARGFPVDQPCTKKDFNSTYPWCTVEW